jgi:hypothetical protein
MNTDNLIASLTKDLAPVKPLPHVGWRMLYLLGAMIFGAGIIFAFFSIRPNLRDVVIEKQFIAGAFIMLVSWISSTYALALRQLPTFTSRKYFIWGLSGICVLACCYLMRGVIDPSFSQGLAVGGVKCSVDIILMSTIPFILLFLVLKKSAPINPMYSGVNVGFCCFTLALFLLQFSCPSNNPGHLLIWHVVAPFSVAAILGGVLGRKLLNW